MDCAMFEDNVLFCQVMFQMCSWCVPVDPDAIVLSQHFIPVSICTDVADVFNFKNLSI